MSTPEHDPTNDLLRALVAGDAVSAFQRLPLEEQDRFLAWIAKAPDAEAYWRRIDILVLGMQMAPLNEAKRKPSGSRPDFWTNPIGRSEP